MSTAALPTVSQVVNRSVDLPPTAALLIRRHCSTDSPIRVRRSPTVTVVLAGSRENEEEERLGVYGGDREGRCEKQNGRAKDHNCHHGIGLKICVRGVIFKFKIIKQCNIDDLKMCRIDHPPTNPHSISLASPLIFFFYCPVFILLRCSSHGSTKMVCNITPVSSLQ
ncbi:hypothetical protein Dimus_028005 [Dionaea muscipula]